MFRRRKQKTYAQMVSDGIYPRGGWTRAFSYVMLRLRRLPDPPHKIARGVAAGVFVCFTPFFGLHILLALALAFVMQGNLLAAVLATFFGNPITFPIIATASLEMGSWMLGLPGGMQLSAIFAAFSNASIELRSNFSAIFTDEPTQWFRLTQFFWGVFMPYLVGGIVPGVFVSLAMYSLSRPVIGAYQKRRIKRLKKKYLKNAERRKKQQLAERQASAEPE